MSRLIVAAHAERDLDNILTYREDTAGQGAAHAYAQRFADTLERIELFPGAGPRRAALGPHTRVTIVLPYVLIYDYNDADDDLVLLRVLHGRRRIMERLLQR